VSYCRWRKEHGGLDASQAKRLKDLERENQRLRRVVSDLTLDMAGDGLVPCDIRMSIHQGNITGRMLF